MEDIKTNDTDSVIRIHNNQNKTFARRIAKSLTNSNKRALADILPSRNSTQIVHLDNYDKKYLEIGFGMGEHFVNMVKNDPTSLYIGAEVFINGVANVLKQLTHENTNYLIWPDDVDLLIEQIPPQSLDGIYILFPDPWHKRRYLKKRLLNKARLTTFKSKIKNGGFISFASDIEDYFSNVKYLLQEDEKLKIEDKDHCIPHAGYIPTKYHLKAIKEGRKPQFITAFLK